MLKSPMLSSYRLPYNLKKLARDLKDSKVKTLSLSLSPHQCAERVHLLHLEKLSIEDQHFLPTLKFQHLGLCDSRLYFYDEVFSSPYVNQLQNQELIKKIEEFLKPHEALLTNGEFFFHGSALVSLVYEFIFQKTLSHNNINIIAKINSFAHPLHPNYYKLPRPLDNSFFIENWAHVGSEERQGVDFDYAMSLDGESLKMDNFFKRQAFNFSQVYFNYQTKTLHWGEGFLEFLSTFTLRLKPENFNLDACLHALRLSDLWQATFYVKDYYPLFVKKFEHLPRGLSSRIQTPLHFSLEGMSIYNLDCVKPMLGKIQNKNYLHYEQNATLPWLQTSALEKNSFILSSSADLMQNLPLYETDTEKFSKHLPQAVGRLYEDFGLNYLTLPLSFLPTYKDYIYISGPAWSLVPAFWTSFIFKWRRVPASANNEELSLLFTQHPFLRERLFEISHYQGAEEAWDFFDSVLSFKKSAGSTFFRFIGFMENHLSLILHRGEGKLFSLTKAAFETNLKSHPDRVLTIPLYLPWFLKAFVSELKSVKELEIEGLRMKHCIGGYDVKIERGISRIFHLQTKHGQSTLETDIKFNITQHKGKLNLDPHEANIKLATLLLKYLKRKK